MAEQRNLRGFIRIDGSGKIMANSLRIQVKPPKNGTWQEIPVYDRFVTMDTSNTPEEFTNVSYAIHVVRGETATYEYDAAATGVTTAPIEVVGPASQLINARADSVVVIEGPMAISILGEYEV